MIRFRTLAIMNRADKVSAMEPVSSLKASMLHESKMDLKISGGGL